MPRQRRQGLTTHSHPGGGWPIRFTFSPVAVPLTSPGRRRGWPPMIIGMKSRSPHLYGRGSVERRSPRNTRVDPTRMGVAETLQTLSA